MCNDEINLMRPEINGDFRLIAFGVGIIRAQWKTDQRGHLNIAFFQ